LKEKNTEDQALVVVTNTQNVNSYFQTFLYFTTKLKKGWFKRPAFFILGFSGKESKGEKKMKTKLSYQFVVVLILSMGVAMGCSSVSVQQYKNESPKLVLEDYFQGTIKAYGIFTGRSGEVKKRFEVTMNCSNKDGVLTLDERFVYSDGEKQTRIWKITKNEKGQYIGKADDVVGEAIGEVAGNALNWKYTLALKVDGSVYNVKFDDWMYLMNEKVMLNKSAMSKFGLYLGEVTLSFAKP
jgi:hypothetical protein